MEKVLYYVGFDVEQERKKFEEVVQYRQFLDRHKDGTYELDWVEGRWCGWLLCVQYKGEVK